MSSRFEFKQVFLQRLFVVQIRIFILLRLLFLYSLSIFLNCTSVMATSNPRDPSTCANYESVTVEHYDLDWTVDLEKKQFRAKIDIRLAALKDADHVVSLFF